MGAELTLGRWLRDRAAATPSRLAIDYAGRLIPYGELDRGADALRGAFARHGLSRGDRVATLTGNSPEHVEAFFACARAGLILVPLNRRLSPAELAFQLDDAEPSLFLVEPELEPLAAQVLEQARSSPLLARPGELEAEAAGAAPPDAVRDDDPLLLIYTSGTTGTPKGALLSHANCFWTNLSFDQAIGVSRDDVVLQTLPQFHVGGWNVQSLLAWWKGATVVLERSFDPARTLALIAEKRVTTTMGVPATYLFMSQDAGFAEADLSSLRTAVVGGAPMPRMLLETWQRRGVEIVQGYGLTEAAPNVLCLPPEDAGRKLGSTGVAYPHVEVALRDAESGRLLEGAGQGEIVVRGPNVFAGYWRDPDASAAAFADGWLLTGDIAERDADGYFWISGRVKDMFISGGENVYPAEIESALHEHADVADVAVLGVPDERWGEVGVAVVVLRTGATASAEELLAHLQARLAKYKVPRRVRFADALPRSGTNKILKDELRAGLLAEVAA